MIQTKYAAIPSYQDTPVQVKVNTEVKESWRGRTVSCLTAPFRFIGHLFSKSVHGLVSLGESLCCCGSERKVKKASNQRSNETLQKKVDKRGLDIDVNYPVPAKADIDPEKKELFLANINSEEHRIVARKVIDKIQYITLEDLQKNLKLAVEKLNQKVRNWDQATLFAVHEKSQYWLAQMALKDMAGLPKELETTGMDMDGYSNVTKPGVSIMFDDCSYSATQLIRIAKNMYTTYAMQKSTADHTVYFVIPYATEYARDIMDMIHKNPAELRVDINHPGSNLKFEFITIADLQLISGAGLTENELQLFNELFYDSRDLEWTTRKALAYMQWKMPDEWSAPTSFLEGRIPQERLRVSPRPIRYIPEIKPPYKKEDI